MGLLTKPPPKNMMEMETCSRSCAVHASPHAARCSRNTLEQPYSQMTNDSVNSADGSAARLRPTTSFGGFTFHAQPKSAKAPIHRPSVRNPYTKKMPPLIVCARTLKTAPPLPMPP